jgi:hypothetical protein
MSSRTGGSQGSQGAGSRSGTSGAGGDNLNADLGETTGDRSSTAFSDTSGTLGRESRGGGGEGMQGTIDQTRQAAQEKLGQVREKATTLKATLADKLEQGAQRIRQRSANASVTEMGAATEDRVRDTGSKVASGMQNTADWLRTADMQSVKSGVERQVRTNPGRTLLVALGLGYVAGRIMRGRR